MDDNWEMQNFGSLSQTGSGDFDSDGMTNVEEYVYGFNPTVNDGFQDADGDRYPNVFELRGGSDPTDSASTPTPRYLVDPAGGGTHTTISAAMNAATTANGAYQIIAIAPGVYTGSANLRGVTVASTKPKLLFIGLQGAAKTIVDGGGTNWGWRFQNGGVVASLTFQNTLGALFVDNTATEVRFVDLLVKNNTTTSTEWASPGLQVNTGATAARVFVVGSTFSNNHGVPSVQQINISAGSATILNTVVWSSTSGTMLAKASGVTLTTNNCLVKGQTLTGTGNLAGTVDPKLLSDGHMTWDSPLRGAGGTVAQSRIDIDSELRPSAAPDIGVDQFVDSDGDQLADEWELQYAGTLTTLTGLSEDADGDGLSNQGEYANGTNPLVTDTDGDGVSDNDEVSVYGTNPLVTDTDHDDMPDGWEIAHGLSATTANAFEDADGDRYPNVFEYAYSTDPSDGGSTPTATYVVDPSGGGTHTTISAAMNAADVVNGAYQIIGIAPGLYTGSANLRGVTVASTKPKLLFIGLQGAGKTIIDGGGTNWGWRLQNRAVVASLTFQNTLGALFVDNTATEVRFVDLVVRDNTTTSTEWATPGLQVNTGATAAKVFVVGSTFYNNHGVPSVQQINISAGSATILNTVVWSPTSGTMLAKGSGVTLTTNNCLVKGQTLTGTGNLAGTVDPKLRSDTRLLYDSPLRHAGGSVAQSRIDIDGELRPSAAPDIGVDQFNDSDGDGLADQWELTVAGNLTTLTSGSQDADGDGLTNQEEYAAFANPFIADTDGDGLSDGDEVHVYGTSPLITDTDADDMPDGWEATYGLSPLIANAFEDADGDRYPNVFEYVNSTNPSDRASTPMPTYLVDAAGGGTHTTISAAMNAATTANGAYQIIAIAPGTYTGADNLRAVTVASTKPKLLFIGLEGAANTIIDGGGTNYGWRLQNAAVVASLTFQNTLGALFVDNTATEARFVDLLVKDNTTTSTEWASPGLQVNTGATAAKVYITGSTFLDNHGVPSVQQIDVSAGSATIVNTLVWSETSGTMLAKASGATLTTNNCLVKGQTLTGTGNLAGTVDPKLRSDVRIRSDSPLRHAGGTVAQSRIDIDGELRPSAAPDIGVDQFNDSDGDGLADSWETANFGNTTSVAGGADADNDELSNAAEYDWETNWLDPDTDEDGLYDGVEVALGKNPLVPDSDDMTSDLNHDGLIDSVGAQLGYQPDQLDSDGDSIPNADELLMCTNPLRSDSDGDGVPDNTDPLPLDPLVSALPSDPQDQTPPVITLTAPSYAVEQ